MNALFAAAVLTVLAGATLVACVDEARAEKPAAKYVCPACGCTADGKEFDKPGNCPACGMPLVEKDSKAATARRESAGRVAILVFDNVEVIDFAGPYEVFGAANYEVYTVGETKAPITSAMGLTVVPTYSFADAPPPDVLVVPGGGVHEAESNAALLEWITAQTARVKHTMSVCNGAFILAKAGLLDGLTATTTDRLIPVLQAAYPKTKVVSDRRYADNGKIITAAGLSSGIDGALHVVEVLRGKGYAQAIALRIEYDWRPDARFVRAALADHLIPDLGIHDDSEWEALSTQGGTDHWELALRPRTDKSAKELMDYFDHALASGKWTRTQNTATRSDWAFKGPDGRAWKGALSVEAGPRAAVKLTIATAERSTVTSASP
jgi:putative intracellular protease/amidase